VKVIVHKAITVDMGRAQKHQQKRSHFSERHAVRGKPLKRGGIISSLGGGGLQRVKVDAKGPTTCGVLLTERHTVKKVVSLNIHATTGKYWVRQKPLGGDCTRREKSGGAITDS